jgi:hypothetical protein
VIKLDILGSIMAAYGASPLGAILLVVIGLVLGIVGGLIINSMMMGGGMMM